MMVDTFNSRRSGPMAKAFCGALVAMSITLAQSAAVEPDGLTIAWEKNYLTIRGQFPGDDLKILYLEAYCRPGSTDRDWKETVIPHTAELIEARADHKTIKMGDGRGEGGAAGAHS